MRIVVEADFAYAHWDDDADHPQYKCYAHIGMVKLQKQWRLCHGNSDDCHPDVIWKPIRDATVHERISAARHIDKLREEIIKQKEKAIPRIESAIVAIAQAVEHQSDD